MTRNRDYGIEIFRCLLMFVIVLHHACCHGLLRTTTSAWIIYPLTIPAVDGFIAISGWYGIRFSWNKCARLWGLMVFYLIFTMGFTALAHTLGWTELRPRLYGWWFAGNYLGLMLFSPFINTALETLAQTPKKLLTAVGLYTLAVFLNWIPTHLFTGVSVSGWGSHSFNTLLFVYVVTRSLHLLLPSRFECYRRWLGLGIIIFCFVFMTCSLTRFYLISEPASCVNILSWLGYDNPGIWLAAILAFLWFYTSHPPQWIGKLCAFLGPSMFGTYLIHEAPIGRYLYRIPQQFLQEHFPGLPIWSILLISALFTFTVCVIVDLCRRVGLGRIIRAWR